MTWKIDENKCCVPLGSETRTYEFPSRKYRSIEVGKVVFPSEKLGILRAPPTSDSEIRVGKYKFPSPMEHSKRSGRRNNTDRRQTQVSEDSLWLDTPAHADHSQQRLSLNIISIWLYILNSYA